MATPCAKASGASEKKAFIGFDVKVRWKPVDQFPPISLEIISICAK
jgi:hypothetical protein